MLDWDSPGATGTLQLGAGVVEEQERRRVGVGLGEAEVAAECAYIAHPNVGHFGFSLGDQGKVGRYFGRKFQGPVGDRWADMQFAGGRVVVEPV